MLLPGRRLTEQTLFLINSGSSPIFPDAPARHRSPFHRLRINLSLGDCYRLFFSPALLLREFAFDAAASRVATRPPSVPADTCFRPASSPPLPLYPLPSPTPSRARYAIHKRSETNVVSSDAHDSTRRADGHRRRTAFVASASAKTTEQLFACVGLTHNFRM